MKRARFTEEQIIAVLREQEAGVPTAEVCRKHGVSSATFYKWKAKYGGLDVSDAKRLRSLEDENGRLKRMLADAMLNNAALKVMPADAGLIRPAEDGVRGQFGAVVANDCVRASPSPSNDVVKFPRHTASGDRGVGDERQAFSGAVVIFCTGRLAS